MRPGRLLAVGVAAVAGVLAASPALAATSTPAPVATTRAGTEAVVTVEPARPEDLSARAAAIVAGQSVRERAAGIVMGHIPTTDAASVRSYLESSGVGGFMLMGANIPATEAELRAFTAALTIDPALPPVLAVDQEGGDVSRLPWDSFPSSLTLKTQPAADTGVAFAGRGSLVQRAGIPVNFGVVADVTADPAAFIFRRALGVDPASGVARVDAAIGGEAPFALSTLKHFPGHGAAPGDSHSTIPSSPLTLAQWSAADALPFQAGIDAGAPLLMFGHLSYPAVDPAPASLSAEWHRIAREQLGFEGVIVTDDLGMLEASGVDAYRDPVANAVAAVVAGNDMVLTVIGSDAGTAGRIVDGLVAAVASGALPQARLDDAARRVVELRLRIASDGRGMMPCAECGPAG